MLGAGAGFFTPLALRAHSKPPAPIVHAGRRGWFLHTARPPDSLETTRADTPRDTARAMSQENVELVRRAFEYEVSGHGTAEVLASFDPYVVMKPVEEGASYGVEAIRDNFEHWQSAWENLEVTIEEIIDAGDRVILSARHRGRGRGSGIEIDARYYEVYSLSRGKIVRVDEYTERDEALEAAGLSE